MASRAFTSWHQLSTQKPPSQPLLTPTCGSLCCHSKAGNSFFTAENERALQVAATSSSPCRKRPFLLGSLVKLLNKSRLALCLPILSLTSTKRLIPKCFSHILSQRLWTCLGRESPGYETFQGHRTWHDIGPHGSPSPGCCSTLFMEEAAGMEEGIQESHCPMMGSQAPVITFHRRGKL